MKATQPHRSSLAVALARVLAFHAVAAGPNDQAAAHYKQGKTFLDAKQYDQAIVEFQAAYAIDKLSSHLYNIADAYDAKHDYDHAIEYFQKYLDAEPKSPRAADVRSRISVATQARADAKRKADEDAARVTAETNRVAAVVHIKQAAAYEQAGAWDKAGDEHKLAFTVDGDPSHLLAAAAAYRKHGDLARTRDAYQAYLDKVPLGETSDGVRAKLADTTREIENADATARAKKEKEDREEKERLAASARNPRVALLASNATAAATRGDCKLARTLGDQVHAEDPQLFDAIVAPGLGVCGKPTPIAHKRYGFAVELRFSVFKTADYVEGDELVRKSTLGSSPAPTDAFGVGAFLDIAATTKFRFRGGLRLKAGSLEYGNTTCPATAMLCPAVLHVLFGGPTISLETAITRGETWDFHFLGGAAVAVPLQKGKLDVETSTGQTTNGPDIKVKTQGELEFGLGFRNGRIFANLIFTVMLPKLSDEFDVGAGKLLSISVGFTTAR